ncbi:hypothetical protein GCM10011613_12820 [Cellvibrio zantedeschiae]|uniref:Uncharacterized protein n=1 Tax=Cellvibrio zantedeschiae TaxID=1237077 RepID=A0ABQ3AXN9_9GAMM|nr:hypothetical protein [Cellvibrio zantedeschiae]GGY69891.1 hypothetical protein GCM10011613_12820 [Cellvibrio zantedeschiae]
MVEQKSPQTDNKADEILVTVITHSLDKSLDDIDELNLQRLKQARANALNFSSIKNRRWIPLAAVASLAALLLVPFVLQNYPHHSLAESEFEIVSQELPLSSEEMDDIDMLMALEDTDA